MKRLGLTFALMLGLSSLCAEKGEPDPTDELVRAIESGETFGRVLDFETPEEDVAYIVRHYKRQSLTVNDPNPELFRRRAREAPDTYFPLLLEGWEEAGQREEADAYLRVLVATYHETRPEALRSLLLPLVRGEDSRSFEPCEECLSDELFLARLAMRQFRWAPSLARPEDAWLMLPYVEESNEYRVASTAIQAISKIADPSIIPALEEAVSRRIEEFPDEYRDPEKYVDVALERKFDKIRARHAEREIETPSSDEGASEAGESDVENSETDESGTDPRAGASPWMWGTGALAVLAALGYARARARGRG